MTPSDDLNKHGDSAPTSNVDLGKALEGGMAALQKVFEGIATAAKKAIGPDVLRNFEAAAWIGRVAGCLEETTVALKDAPANVAGKSGELACYLEQLETEIRGSKFVNQQASLRQRLDGVVQALAGDPSGAAQKAAEAAGYFRASANSVGPVPAPSDKIHVNFS